MLLTSSLNICHICKVTVQPDDQWTNCKTCKSPFHNHHLDNWISVDNRCPNCYQKYKKSNFRVLSKRRSQKEEIRSSSLQKHDTVYYLTKEQVFGALAITIFFTVIEVILLQMFF